MQSRRHTYIAALNAQLTSHGLLWLLLPSSAVHNVVTFRLVMTDAVCGDLLQLDLSNDHSQFMPFVLHFIYVCHTIANAADLSAM